MKVIKYEILDSIIERLGIWVNDYSISMAPEAMLELLEIIFDAYEQEEKDNDQ